MLVGTTEETLSIKVTMFAAVIAVAEVILPLTTEPEKVVEANTPNPSHKFRLVEPVREIVLQSI